jgi:hypothetical protein
MTLDLDVEHARVLLETVESAIGEVKEEIYHSETQEFKEGLRRRKEILSSIRDQLAGGGAEESTARTVGSAKAGRPRAQ